MKNKLLLYIILIFYSCSNDKVYVLESSLLKNYIKSEFSNDEIGFNLNIQIVLIPSLGCSPCVKKIWKYYEENNLSNTIFISSKSNNAKGHSIVNKLLIENDDINGSLDELIFMDIYPMLIQFDNEGDIILMEELSPRNEKKFKKSLFKK